MKKQLKIYMDEEKLLRLKKESVSRGVSYSKFVEAIFDEWLKDNYYDDFAKLLEPGEG